MSYGIAGISLSGVAVKYDNKSFKKGRDGTGLEGSLAEGKGRSRRDRKGASWKGRDDRDVILMEGKELPRGQEGKGREGKGREGTLKTGQEGSLMEGKGREGRGREGRGRDGKGRAGR